MQRKRGTTRPTQLPSTETVLAHLVAFVLSAAMLLAFGRIDSINRPMLASAVVLAYPGSLGAALEKMLVSRKGTTRTRR